MATVFVTGSSGYVGRNLIRALHAQGDTVRGLVRSVDGAAVVAGLGAEPVTGDLDTVELLQQAMTGCETVYHVAAFVSDWGSYDDAYHINVIGTENVLTAARSAGVSRFVHFSTEAVLVGSGAPKIVNADETWPLPTHPLGVYPRTKGLAELRVRAANSPELATMIVRPRLIWGNDDTNVLRQMVEAVRQGKYSWIGGKHLTSTTHVSNVCEGAILAAKYGQGGAIYFLTDGAPIEFRSFITAMLETQGVTPGSRTLPFWLAETIAIVSEKAWQIFKIKGSPPLTRTTAHLFGQEVTLDDSKARRELGYTGAVSRATGLSEMKAAGPMHA